MGQQKNKAAQAKQYMAHEEKKQDALVPWPTCIGVYQLENVRFT